MNRTSRCGYNIDLIGHRKQTQTKFLPKDTVTYYRCSTQSRYLVQDSDFNMIIVNLDEFYEPCGTYGLEKIIENSKDWDELVSKITALII